MNLISMMKKNRYILLLLAIFFSHIFLSYHVMKKSQVARIYDEKERICQGFGFYRLLFLQPEINCTKKLERVLFLDIHQGHPHFFELAEALSWRILHAMKREGVDAVIFITNSAFLLIVLASVYAIGSIRYNKDVGLLSALFISMFPLVFGHARVSMLDFPLMSMTALSMYALLKTNGFQSLLYSIIAGIVFGLSQLTKETYILFILSPLIYYVIQSYSSGKKKKITFNLIICILFFFIISAAVYFRSTNLHALTVYIHKIYINKHGPGFLYYLKNARTIIGPCALFVSLPLFLSYVLHIKKRDALLFFWFFVPLILFSIPTNKGLRFLLPIVPAFALIVIGEVFVSQLFKKMRAAYIFILLSFSTLQYCFYNYGFLNVRYAQNAYPDYGLLSPLQDKYLPISSALLDIFKKEALEHKDSRQSILFLFQVPQIYCQLQLYFFLDAVPFRVLHPLDTEERDVVETKQIDWREVVLAQDYIVDKTGFAFRRKKHREDIAAGLREGFAKYKNDFVKIAEIRAYDNSFVYVYKKIKE